MKKKVKSYYKTLTLSKVYVFYRLLLESIRSEKAALSVPIRTSLSDVVRTTPQITECEEGKNLRITISSPSILKTHKCVTNLRAALG